MSMAGREITEYAVWFDTALPDQAGADIRCVSTRLSTVEVYISKLDPSVGTPNICRRTLYVTEGEWEAM